MGQNLNSPFAGKARKTVEEDVPEKASLPYHQPNLAFTKPSLTPREREEQCYIQPHTDAGGDAYYIGDAYEPAKFANEWAIDVYVLSPTFVG